MPADGIFVEAGGTPLEQTRFRLKFLLQEFDLQAGEVLLGRSPECQVTIEDPLISREHAKIIVEDGDVVFEDLGSKNGSRVNGRRIEGRVPLKDGDRIRIGAQELVFCAVVLEVRHQRSTGAMIQCTRCQVPFPEGATVCPHCGAPVPARRRTQPADCPACGEPLEAGAPFCPRCGKMVVREDETVTGISRDSEPAWSFQLLVQVLDRALARGRADEAERLLGRFAQDIDDQIGRAQEVDSKILARFAERAVMHVEAGGSVRWTSWILGTYRKINRLPPSNVAEHMLKLVEAGRPIELGHLDEFFEGSPPLGNTFGRTLQGDEVNALAALEAIRTARGHLA